MRVLPHARMRPHQLASHRCSLTPLLPAAVALPGDFSLIKGHVADTRGNIIFRRTARNFNPDMAKAGRICIAEVEEIVEPGELDPGAWGGPCARSCVRGSAWWAGGGVCPAGMPHRLAR